MLELLGRIGPLYCRLGLGGDDGGAGNGSADACASSTVVDVPPMLIILVAAMPVSDLDDEFPIKSPALFLIFVEAEVSRTPPPCLLLLIAAGEADSAVRASLEPGFTMEGDDANWVEGWSEPRTCLDSFNGCRWSLLLIRARKPRDEAVNGGGAFCESAGFSVICM